MLQEIGKVKLLACLIWILGMAIVYPAKATGFEEVQILNVETQQVPVCSSQPSQEAQGSTGKQILGTGLGAVAGGLVGGLFGRGKGKTATTIAGAAVGGYTGYKLTESDKSAQQVQCQQVNKYKVSYKRQSGMTGIAFMGSFPTGKTTVINFCHVGQDKEEQPC